MKVEVRKNLKNVFTDVTQALCVAYSQDNYVLVQRNKSEWNCLIIPITDTYTIIIDNEGIEVDLNEFVEFKNPDLFNWEDCTFTVISRHKVKLLITLD